MSNAFAEVEFQRDQMHAYQADIAVPFLKVNPFSALFIDMGLGKTVSSLTVISDLLADIMFEPGHEDDKVLVIGPLKVACDTWPTEIGKWQHTAWLRHTLIRADDDDPRISDAEREDRKLLADRSFDRDYWKAKGLTEAEIKEKLGATNATRVRREIMEELARSKTQLHIINREQVEWLVNFYREKWPYRIVFIDESSSFKDHNSVRFNELAKVRRTPGLITRMHLLTATPAAETYEHLFAQIYLLDLGERLGKNITRYRNRYFTQNKYTYKYVLREGAEEEILEKLADICLVMRAKDYLKRNEPQVIRRSVRLSPAILEMIKGLEKEFVLKLPDGTLIEAKTAAMLASMMLQMASGSVYETKLEEDWDTDDLKKVKKVHHIHNHKIEALKEIAEEASTQGEPLLVSYHFQSSLAKLRKAFPKAVVMDEAGKCIKDWNKGKIPMLLVHPQSAGHGLNLQKGGHIVVMYDLIHSLEQYLQLIGRLDRQGQPHPFVQVILLVAEGTRDTLVADNNVAKQDAQEKLFAILKRLIAKYRKKSKATVEEAL